ncbi:MAG: flagellar biosynthetic protein FliQ [Sphingomonadaceae bacterium]|uniref:flagellar biosynthetic protein FliQ n=1 Tax=Thermaurantiacus sp. TaxID=2820283 RepID=UPI00298EEBE6|nr:flagellar biosynthetic protein FliQ [Thermaurantiacus sp.]MCS6987002.1 flagellar biosynthetic protein FliQ [Sphingomonadaceae bacterium]MDW8415660.1 flagellar biosynthetic protein FliQ [Thermaurantiacus sp.]
MSGEDLLHDLTREALVVLAVATMPPLLAALAIGLVVGLLQAATSINEATLSFVPKLLGVVLVLVAFGGIVGGLVADFTREAITAIPRLGR